MKFIRICRLIKSKEKFSISKENHSQKASWNNRWFHQSSPTYIVYMLKHALVNHLAQRIYPLVLLWLDCFLSHVLKQIQNSYVMTRWPASHLHCTDCTAPIDLIMMQVPINAQPYHTYKFEVSFMEYLHSDICHPCKRHRFLGTTTLMSYVKLPN